MAENFSKFNDHNKSRIFEQVIELAADPYQDRTVRSVAQTAIFATYPHLDANQRNKPTRFPTSVTHCSTCRRRGM